MSTAVIQRATHGLIRRESASHGVTAREAVERIARRLRLATGTITRILRGTAKRVTADARDALIAAYIADLSRQMRALEHEKQVLLQMGFGPSHRDMDAVETALAQARQAIFRMAGEVRR